MNINDLLAQSEEQGAPNGIDTSLSLKDQLKKAQEKVDQDGMGDISNNSDMDVLKNALSN
jgi:hypothetical protein|tara:strand:+ start:439 stop:618 length:180 start_codon:yes stop_codon:yes gene_type:complete